MDIGTILSTIESGLTVATVVLTGVAISLTPPLPEPPADDEEE